MAFTDTEIEDREEEHHLRTSFPRSRIGARLAETAIARRRGCATVDERVAASDDARAAMAYAGHAYRSGAYDRHASLDDWFAIPALGYDEVVARGRTLLASWRAAGALPDPDDEAAYDAYEAEERAREDEEERISRIEESGGYGRTVAHSPEADSWIYVRFGRMPADGRSAFGLAGEDNEEGPDPWRTEMGNMTHEAGTCVLRAYRHPDVEGAYVVMEPHFDHAVYGVSNRSHYFLSIIPHYEPDEEPMVLRVDGSPLTSRARDRTLRMELGSDGEYMIDPRRPVATVALDLDTVYVSEATSAAEYLLRHRGYAFEGTPAGPGM